MCVCVCVCVLHSINDKLEEFLVKALYFLPNPNMFRYIA